MRKITLHALTLGSGHRQYNLSDRISLEGALRYNRDNRTFDNCAIDTTDGFRFWNLFSRATPPTRLGQCYVVDFPA